MLSTIHYPLFTTLQARHYETGDPLTVRIEAGRIVGMESLVGVSPSSLPWIAPGFFDVQINGCLGISFNSPTLTADQIHTVAKTCRDHGIGRFLPTLITGSFAAILHGFTTLIAATEADGELVRSIPGYHLEGPYLSAEDGPRGAHPKEHIRDPDWDEFRRWQDAARGQIRMVTLAPERPGARRFIEQLTASGVVVAIGHTAATGPQIRAAVEAGAKISTHLGNGCHAMLPRHDNYIWEQLADDRLWASIIPDGHHLPVSVFKSIVRVKTPQRLILTCDASSLAGLPPGRYAEWGQEFDVQVSGKVVVPNTPFLAGSGHFADHCVSQVLKMTDLTLRDAIDMVTRRPCELFGLPIPAIAVGEPADVVVFDWQPGGEIRVNPC